MTRARLPAAHARRCTCWPGSLGLRVPLRVKLEAIRLGLAVRARPPAGGADARAVLRALRSGRRGAASALGSARARDPERVARSARRRCCSTACTRRRSCAIARASRLVFLRRGWGVLAERLARYFEARGGVVRRGTRAERLALADGRVDGRRRAPRARSGREAIAAGEPARAARSSRRTPSCAPSRRTACRPAAGGVALAGRRSTRSRASAARRSCRSRCGSTAWSWTA